MAKARMLHKKISVSTQVNKLSLSAKLLFTWLIPHADDDGRLKGDPEYIKAMVVPMTKWSFKKVEQCLKEINDIGLIFWWTDTITHEKFIEFIKWNDYQTIRKDRYIKSNLPLFKANNDIHGTTKDQPLDDQQPTQSNTSELNLRKVNKSESNAIKNEFIADKNSFNNIADLINPKKFEPTNEGENAVFEAWKKLEPFNPLALTTTYLKSFRRGLPPEKFYQFTSEINQDPTIKSRGAVFNKKVEDYFKKKAT